MFQGAPLPSSKNRAGARKTPTGPKRYSHSLSHNPLDFDMIAMNYCEITDHLASPQKQVVDSQHNGAKMLEH